MARIIIEDVSIQGLLDGSVTQPSLFFLSEPGMGLYRAGAAQMGIAMLGAELWAFRGGSASGSDYTGFQFQANNSGQGAKLQATSTAANEAFYLDPKGTGILYLNTQASTGETWIGAGGTIRLRGNMLLTNSSYFDIEQIAVPAAPAVGTRRVFVSSVTGAFSIEDSTGKVYDLELGAFPPGADKQVVFNDGGAWGANASFTYTKGTTTLTVPNIASPVTVTGNSGLTITPTAGGGLLTITGAAGQGGFIRFPANVGAGLSLYDGTSTYYVINTQTGTDNVIGHDFRPATISYASAAGSTYSLARIGAVTVTLTGGVGVTAMAGLSLLVNSPTVSSAAATTITTASAVQINGPLPAGAGPATFTNSIALDIPTYATNGTTASGIRIAVPTGAGTNYAINVISGTSNFAGLISGSLGLTITGAAVSLNASSNFNTAINTGTSTGSVTIGNSAAAAVNITSNAASTFAFTGGAFILQATSQALTVQTVTSGTLAVTSAGALNLTGVAASTFAFSGGAFILQATSQNLTVQTITSGTLALTSAGALNHTSVAASTWAHSGGAFAINSTSQNLTIATITSGTLALTSAGAVNTTSAAASTWTHSGGAWALNSTSQNVTIATITSGTLAVTSAGALNLTGAAASTWAQVANTALALKITDGTTNLLAFDTRTGTDNVKAALFTPQASISYASAAGTTFNAVATAAFTLTLTGGVLVTALKGLGLNLGAPTVTSASATTVTDGSTLYVAAPVAAGAGPVTITNKAAIATGGDIIPDADNSYNVGTAARRFALVRATTITSGDLKFENDWYFTEGDRVGLDRNTIALVRPNGTIAQVFA